MLVALFVWTFSVTDAATIMYSPRMPYVFMFLALIYFIFWPFFHWSDRMERFVHIHSALQWFNFMVLGVMAWIFASQLLHCDSAGQSCSDGTQVGLYILEFLVLLFAFLYLVWSFCHSATIRAWVTTYQTSYAGHGYPFAYGPGYGYGYGGVAQQQQQQQEEAQDQQQTQGNQLGPTHVVIQNSVNNQPSFSQKDGFTSINANDTDYSNLYNVTPGNSTFGMQSLPVNTSAHAHTAASGMPSVYPSASLLPTPSSNSQSTLLLQQQQPPVPQSLPSQHLLTTNSLNSLPYLQSDSGQQVNRLPSASSQPKYRAKGKPKQPQSTAEGMDNFQLK